MEDTRVDPLSATEPTDLSELVRQLCREVADLRQEVDQLRRENLELRQQVGYWKAQHARAVHRAEHLEAEVENLRGENRKLQDQLFCRKSEKSSTRDRSNHLDGESDGRDSFTPRKPGQQKDRPGPKRRDYSHLPVVEDLRELPEDQRVCPQCGEALSPSDTEDSRSRSRCGRIADGSDGDVISGRAPVRTVLEPSRLPRHPS
jgi:FtsZ-binding cell division protein ZapB